MNVAMFEQYNSSENKNDIEVKIFMYSTVVGFLLIILLIVMNKLDKDLYYQNNLIIINNKSTLLNVLPMDLSIIENNNYLMIDNKKYYYNIEKIELINENSVYYQIILDMQNDLLVNSLKSCKILIRKEKMFNNIIRIIKGG